MFSDGKARQSPASSPEDETLAKELENKNEQISLSLLQQEQQKRSILAEEELKHREASSKVESLYQEAHERYKNLSAAEKLLSSQAGQLLNALQREEARAAKLSATVRKIRHTRKKMLGNIANPRWEVQHHYHMTCLEHSLGHTQPHVLEVGKMVPGHLRLFTFARLGVLIHKSLILSLNRAKVARTTFSEKIKDVYRSLRQTRQDLKEQSKLLDAMRKKSHLLGRGSGGEGAGPSLGTSRQGGAQPLRRQRNQIRGPDSFRMRYFKSLNMSPDNVEVQKLLQRWEKDITQDWKHVMRALNSLEKQALSKNKAREELMFVESCLQRFNGGFTGIPQPLSLVQDMESLDLSDDEEDLMEDLHGEELFDAIQQSEKLQNDDAKNQKKVESPEKGSHGKVHGAPEKGRLQTGISRQKSMESDAEDEKNAKRAKELVEEQVKQQGKGNRPWAVQKKSIRRGPSSRTRRVGSI